jgi:excinuclease ABC subunit A
MRDYKGQRIGLLAPLSSPQGRYTDLAKWAQARASRTCASTARFLPVEPFRASIASRSTRSSCRSPTCGLPRHEAELRAGARQGARARQGRRHRAVRLERSRPSASEGTAVAMHQQSFSTRRACPSCGRSFAEPDPRLFSYNSKHGWCAAATAPGCS